MELSIVECIEVQTWNPGIRQVPTSSPLSNNWLDLLYCSPLTYVSNPGQRFVNSQLAMVIKSPCQLVFFKMFMFSFNYFFLLFKVFQINTEVLNTLTPGLRFCKTFEEFSGPKSTF